VADTLLGASSDIARHLEVRRRHSIGTGTTSRYKEGFHEVRESAYAFGLEAGRESIVHALTAARFGPDTADRVVALTRSIDERECYSGIGSAARIGICVLTCTAAEDLLARVREVKEEESNRARRSLAPQAPAPAPALTPRPQSPSPPPSE